MFTFLNIIGILDLSRVATSVFALATLIFNPSQGMTGAALRLRFVANGCQPKPAALRRSNSSSSQLW